MGIIRPAAALGSPSRALAEAVVVGTARVVDVPDRVSLTLAGHTHGGQIRLFGYSPVIPSVHGNDFAYGHVTLGGRHMIVSGGFGVSRVPVRLGVPPEIVLLDLGTAPAVAGRQPGSA